MPDSRIEAVIWSLIHCEIEQLDRARTDAEPLVAEMLTAARLKLLEALDWLAAASAESDAA